MQTHLRIRNGCRKSITSWYALTWESLNKWRDKIPEMISDLEAAISDGDHYRILELSEIVFEVEEIRDSVDSKLTHWEIEYADISVQPLPEDQFEKSLHEISFTGIGFPFKAREHEYGITYEVDEEKLFAEEIKGEVCILFYTYDNRCSYEYLLETSQPFDPNRLAYHLENNQSWYNGYMTYEGLDITQNWWGSGDECDGVHAVYVKGFLIKPD